MTSRTPWLLPALALAVAIALPATAASAAVTLVNRDDKDHKLTVIEDNGTKTTEHILKPSQVLEGICERGCVVRINDSEEDEYELEAGDKVSIEEGYLYYDEPDAAQQGSSGGAPERPQPGAGEAPKKQ
jgi:hypothetical protein